MLLAGNVVAAEFRARTDVQLPALTVELVHSRARSMASRSPPRDRLGDRAAAAALPEAQPYPRLHAALEGVLSR